MIGAVSSSSQTRAASLRAAPVWIESPTFDLVFLILVPIIAAPVAFAPLFAGRITVAALSAFAFVLATAHYLSTFAFYFWDDNRAHHRARWLTFFGGPALLATVYLAIVGLGAEVLVFTTLLLWNTYHVSRQSCGIVSLYRHSSGITDSAQKRAANIAIVATNLWFALWNVETFIEIVPLLHLLGPWLVQTIRLGCGIVAIAALAHLGVALSRRIVAGRAPRVPEVSALLAALMLFHPYLWFPDSMSATFAMLAPHYVQYLGLLWLLHRRKFRSASGSGSSAQWVLRRISGDTILLVFVLLGAGSLMLVGQRVMGRLGWGYQFSMLYILLAFLHYYLDSLFWAFKDPHVRMSLGPYVRPRTAAATT